MPHCESQMWCGHHGDREIEMHYGHLEWSLKILPTVNPVLSEVDGRDLLFTVFSRQCLSPLGTLAYSLVSPWVNFNELHLYVCMQPVPIGIVQWLQHES
jgi:hypothetical protein